MRHWLFLRLDQLQVLLVNLLLPAARLSAGRQLPTAWHRQLRSNRLYKSVTYSLHSTAPDSET